MADYFTSVLQGGETIIWQGQPSLRAPNSLRDKFFRVSALIVGSLALIIAWRWWSNFPHGNLILNIAITSIAIGGIVSAFTPRKWLYRRILAFDHYLITNKRAIVVRTPGEKAKFGLSNQTLHSWPLDRSIWPQKTENAVLFEFIDTRVDNLITWRSGSDSGYNTGFVLLENADIPYREIRKVLDT